MPSDKYTAWAKQVLADETADWNRRDEAERYLQDNVLPAYVRRRVDEITPSVVTRAVPTVIFACSDCHYVETYLRADAFQNRLETYDGWERASAPADGPFR